MMDQGVTDVDVAKAFDLIYTAAMLTHERGYTSFKPGTLKRTWTADSLYEVDPMSGVSMSQSYSGESSGGMNDPANMTKDGEQTVEEMPVSNQTNYDSEPSPTSGPVELPGTNPTADTAMSVYQTQELSTSMSSTVQQCSAPTDENNTTQSPFHHSEQAEEMIAPSIEDHVDSSISAMETESVESTQHLMSDSPQDEPVVIDLRSDLATDYDSDSSTKSGLSPVPVSALTSKSQAKPRTKKTSPKTLKSKKIPAKSSKKSTNDKHKKILDKSSTEPSKGKCKKIPAKSSRKATKGKHEKILAKSSTEPSKGKCKKIPVKTSTTPPKKSKPDFANTRTTRGTNSTQNSAEKTKTKSKQLTNTRSNTKKTTTKEATPKDNNNVRILRSRSSRSITNDDKVAKRSTQQIKDLTNTGGVKRKSSIQKKGSKKMRSTTASDDKSTSNKTKVAKTSKEKMRANPQSSNPTHSSQTKTSLHKKKKPAPPSSASGNLTPPLNAAVKTRTKANKLSLKMRRKAQQTKQKQSSVTEHSEDPFCNDDEDADDGQRITEEDQHQLFVSESDISRASVNQSLCAHALKTLDQLSMESQKQTLLGAVFRATPKPCALTLEAVRAGGFGFMYNSTSQNHAGGIWNSIVDEN